MNKVAIPYLPKLFYNYITPMNDDEAFDLKSL